MGAVVLVVEEVPGKELGISSLIVANTSHPKGGYSAVQKIHQKICQDWGLGLKNHHTLIGLGNGAN